jgi:polyhydroxybutyrate depolymerase
MKLLKVAALALVLLCFVGVALVWAQDGRLKFGTNKIDVSFAGASRSYVAWVPNPYVDGQPMPLVVVLHGTIMDPDMILRVGHFTKFAELKRFIAVAPRSLGRAFNDNSGRGGPEAKDVDDVGFVEAVVTDVRQRASIDPKRIFLVGFSSGGAMAQRVAIESAYDFAAIVAIADHFYVASRVPARPRPLLLAWGTADKFNPMSGGRVQYPGVVLEKPAPEQSAAEWAQRLACRQGPDKSLYRDGVQRSRWSQCAGPTFVEAYFVDGLGHHWAGGEPLPLFPERVIGPYSARFEMTELMWDFFQRGAP